MLNVWEGVNLVKHPFLCISGLLLFGCAKKANSSSCNATYGKDIVPIINAKCALSSCHTAGTALPDLTQYSVVKANADNGRRRINMFDLKIMPPASAKQLTEDEKAKFKCWLDDGAAEN